MHPPAIHNTNFDAFEIPRKREASLTLFYFYAKFHPDLELPLWAMVTLVFFKKENFGEIVIFLST